MFSRDTWREIFITLRKNKLRTFLSGFTVALGILIFIILFGMGNGLLNTFNDFFGDDATNVIYIFPGRTSIPYKGYKSNRNIEFDNSDLTDIEETFPMFVEHISPRIFRTATTSYKEESNDYTTIGVDWGQQFAEKTIIMQGRYINQRDVEERTRNAVIGRLVEVDLFNGRNAIGKYIDIGGSVFKVVGVFQDDGGDNEERQIYIPYTTRQLIEKNTDEIGQIVVQFKPELGYTGAMAFEKNLRLFLKDKKFISPEDQNGFFIRNVADNLKQNQDFAGVLQMIVSIVAFGTIIAGIIGISNIMVYVVKERTKEIGIRKVLGASVLGIMKLLTKEYTKWIIVANFISWPIAWYFMNSWLQNFAYRIQISWETFIISGLSAFIIALFTIGFQSIRTAFENPIKSLRYE